jgi:hypothetical protein
VAEINISYTPKNNLLVPGSNPSGPTTLDRVTVLLPGYASDFSSGLPLLPPVLPAAESTSIDHLQTERPSSAKPVGTLSLELRYFGEQWRRSQR